MKKLEYLTDTVLAVASISAGITFTVGLLSQLIFRICTKSNALIYAGLAILIAVITVSIIGTIFISLEQCGSENMTWLIVFGID